VWGLCGGLSRAISSCISSISKLFSKYLLYF
jgi:hypothetical protein